MVGGLVGGGVVGGGVGGLVGGAVGGLVGGRVPHSPHVFVSVDAKVPPDAFVTPSSVTT